MLDDTLPGHVLQFGKQRGRKHPLDPSAVQGENPEGRFGSLVVHFVSSLTPWSIPPPSHSPVAYQIS
jgi:hypothetical protein